MKHVDAYRDPARVARLAGAIREAATKPCVLMEVCGGQTHAIVKYGLDELLPPNVELVHGPGCPVCVTPLETLDRAQAIAARPDVTLCTFGDMLRVPGSRGDLFSARARGADVRVVYSPLDAVDLAAREPKRQIVLLAIGFETTAPANAMAIAQAKRRGLTNFSALSAHVLTPPAMAAIVQAPESRVNAFLGPGHVCTVTGTRELEVIAKRYRVPIVVAGFEPVDLLEGVLLAARQVADGRAEVEIPYARAVRREGNPSARRLVDEVFEVVDRPFRGVGFIPKAGLRLAPEYAAFDAERRFDVDAEPTREPGVCISGRILKGLAKPPECPAFGGACTPHTPLGATMVSSEGACAAYHAYARLPREARP